mmetsp:Transcript_7002/g.12876  ORF Transcript_7002/g.12876 Transcript_7002/m.12876 type:complete len:142 (+) Transcript_7002:125-550(+)
MNPESMRKFNVTDEDYTNKLVRFVKDTQRRPLLLAGEDPENLHFILKLYAAGVMPSDVVIFNAISVFSGVINGSPAEDKAIAFKYALSWLDADYAFFLGDVGETLRLQSIAKCGLHCLLNAEHTTQQSSFKRLWTSSLRED